MTDSPDVQRALDKLDDQLTKSAGLDARLTILESKHTSARHWVRLTAFAVICDVILTAVTLVLFVQLNHTQDEQKTLLGRVKAAEVTACAERQRSYGLRQDIIVALTESTPPPSAAIIAKYHLSPHDVEAQLAVSERRNVLRMKERRELLAANLLSKPTC